MQVPNSLTDATTLAILLLLTNPIASVISVAAVPNDTYWRANEYTTSACASPISIAHDLAVVEIANSTRAVDTATPNDAVAVWQVFAEYNHSSGRCAGFLLGEMPGGCWDLSRFEVEANGGRVGCLYPNYRLGE
ncbi:Uu.00g064860.m01.CDS01 [Anthostomella pinea]|uniref:Uu.00g064860.m01.CDS01 n=1 Tax=Anthostomella pinea TaxID=933095 RepID=A0AAI8VTM3_9PEZI|nr:Uu.00g064860.m01.CDS01 [Anthostomella pinea]